MSHISQPGLDPIKQFAGFSPVIYTCPAGPPNIDYGHLIDKGEHFGSITEEETEVLLRHDVEIAKRILMRLINVPLTDGQLDALISFIFNLGAGALQRSTLRCKVNRQQHDEVPAQLMR